MTDIVSKLWGFCHTLRHDGIDYGDYIEQLTYLLFLKIITEKGVKLWASERKINDSWCYGFSPDIPWTFSNDCDADVWFKHYDKLKPLIEDFVQPHYWDAIDSMRLRF